MNNNSLNATQRLLTKRGQYDLLTKWLIYLSMPILFVVVASKWAVTGKISMVLKMAFLFMVVPFLMVFFSTRPSVYATKTSFILMLVGIYGAVWLFTALFNEPYVKEALDPETGSRSLAVIHMIGIIAVAIIATSYMEFSKTAIVNGAKISGA